MKKFIPLIICLFILIAPIGAHARIIGVPGDSPTIKAGIDASTPGDTVLVQPGRYLETIDFKGKDIVIGSLFITTQDTSYISKTIIDGNKMNTVVTFQTGETSAAELCGFTITNGASRGSVFHPEYNSGGGICCKGASPYLHHLNVIENRSSMDGGGMYLEKSNSVIEHCVISNNRASSMGGGIYFINGLHAINNLLFFNNNSPDGGGCKILLSKVKMEHCVYFKNISSYGRAIYNVKSELLIINSTIADHEGYDAIFSLGSKIIIINSILWNNCEYEVESRSESWGYSPSNITVIYSDIKNHTTMIHVDKNDSTFFDTVFNINPLFFNSSQNDYRLLKNSPCRDVGISHYILNNDAVIDLSKEYYQGIAPDIGAYELDAIVSSVCSNNTVPLSCVTNYPNPFNVSTSIKIEMNSSCSIRIAVFNILGENIKTIFSGNLSTGRHLFVWNAKRESTGVYFYKVDMENTSYIGKMLLIK